jgi:hypothetical protein
MPNWCENHLTVIHADATQLVRVQDAYARRELFQEFVPCNVDEYIAYSWRVENWGTKWDVGGEAGDFDMVDNQLIVRFDTAWAPPLGFYEKLTELGFDVNAYYYEPGMEFCGRWTSEHGNDEYSIDGNSNWVTENIPVDIDQHMGISSLLADWEEEQEETK